MIMSQLELSVAILALEYLKHREGSKLNAEGNRILDELIAQFTEEKRDLAPFDPPYTRKYGQRAK